MDSELGRLACHGVRIALEHALPLSHSHSDIAIHAWRVVKTIALKFTQITCSGSPPPFLHEGEIKDNCRALFSSICVCEEPYAGSNYRKEGN